MYLHIVCNTFYYATWPVEYLHFLSLIFIKEIKYYTKE